MKTKLEIIDETVAYYSEDPVGRRAVSDAGGYQYFNKYRQACAVGRCMIDAEKTNLKIEEMLEDGDVEDTAVDSLDIALGLDKLLEKEYRGHEMCFWKDLQGFHDYALNWNPEGGLTAIGQSALTQLKDQWIN